MGTLAGMVANRPSSPGIAEQLFSIFAGLCVSGSALAQSSLPTSPWPLFRHDPQLTGRAYATGPSIPQVNWVTELGAGQLGAPAVGINGTIYLAGEVDNNLYAIGADGTLMWKFQSSAPFLASPVVGNDGTIYLGNSTGHFYGIDPDGEERWKISLGGAVRFSANMSDDGTIYVVADDANLYALTSDGEMKWRQPLDRPPLATPAVTPDRTVITVAGEFLASFRPNGVLQWRTSFPDMGNVDGVVAERSDKLIIISQNQPLIRAVNASTGAPIWTFSYRAAWGNPSLPALAADGGIFFASSKGSHLFALNPDGTERWVYTDRNAELRKPPVLDDSSNIYVTNDSLGLISFTSRGNIRWHLPEIRGCYSPAFAENRTIYIAGNRKVFAIGQQSSHIGALDKISGDTQTGCAGSTLPTPLAVLVRDQFNRPFADQFIRFSVVAGGGSLSDTLVQSDNQGIARVFWTLGPTSLPQQVQAAGALQNQPTVNFHASAAISQLQGSSALSFGKVETGALKHLSLSLATADNCPILITSLELSGADTSAFSPDQNGLPRRIIKGIPVSIDIRFSPNRFGLHTTTLLVFHDQSSQPLAVQLTGEGECTSPQISLLSSSLPFDEIPIGDTKSISLRVSNVGCDTLIVNNLQNDLSVFQVSNPSTPFFLLPGEGRNLVVSFSPTDTLLYADMLRISSNDPNSGIATLSLSGQGKLPWTVEPSSLSFGAICVAGKSTIQFELCNISSRVLQSSSITIESGQFQVEPNDFLSVPPNACKKVTISFRPETMGAAAGTLTVAWASSLGLPRFVLPLAGEGIVTQLSGPDTMRFGSIPVGTSARVDSTFHNQSECDIVITSISAHGTNSQTFVPVSLNLPLTVAAGATAAIGASFNAKHAGVAVADLKIGTQGSVDTLRVTLFAKVTAPDIDVARSFVFPVSPFCNEVTAFLPIHNRGDDSLRISSIITNGSNQTDFRIGLDHFPLSVPPRDSIQVAVIFDPKGSGARATNLFIASNDPDTSESIVIVNVSGSATSGPDIETSLRTVDFDSVVVDSSLTLPLTLYNGCSEPLAIEAFSLNRSPFFASFERTIVASFDSVIVNVTFSPKQTIGYGDSLVIHSNDADENPLVVKLSGVGIAPDIDIERDESLTHVNGRIAPASGKASSISSAAELNLGKTCVKDTAKYSIIIHNRGESELIVYELKTDSRFFSIAPAGNFTIPPHGQSKALLTFTPDSPRTFVDVLTVWSNDPDENPYIVPLRGDGISPELELQAHSLDAFKHVPVNLTADAWVKIANSGTSCGLDIDAIYIKEKREDEAGGFTLLNEGMPHLEADSSTSVWMRFSPRAEKSYEGMLVVVYNDRQDTLSHPFVGAGVELRALLDVSANRVDFGAVPVGDLSCDARTVYLRNRGNAPLLVSRLETNGPFEIDSLNLPIYIAPGDSSEPLRICYKPDNAGIQIGTLTVKSDANNKAVDLNGVGDQIPAALSVCFSQPEVNFGRVALRDSSVQLMTITNCNDFTISIRPITTSSSEFRVTPDSAKLLPNQSFALALIFKPATLGFREGTVSLTTVSGDVVSDTTIQLYGEVFVKGQSQVTVSPNPFTPNGDGINEHTVFDFSAFDINHPTLKVFNLAGRLIRNLEYRGGQRHEFTWDGLDDDGHLIAPGLFIYIIEEDGRKIESGHVVMVR